MSGNRCFSPIKVEKFVIFSDSLSSLQAIAGFNIDNDRVQKFNKEYTVQAKQGKTIALCWIPSHGSEKADSAAKGGLSLSVTALKSPASELLPGVTKLIPEKWQKLWNNSSGNKLQSINPTTGVYQHVRSSSRRDAVFIYRLRIGHTCLTRSYLLLGTDQPECLACHCPLTVTHILIEFPALTITRNKHLTVSSMKDLFDNVASRNIINFIKESHFYSTV